MRSTWYSIRMCLFFFVHRIFSTLPCLDTPGVAPRKHQVTSTPILAAAAGVRGQAGTRTPENSPGYHKNLQCKPAFMAACSTMPIDVDGTPRDSSNLSRQCAVWARPTGCAARRWLLVRRIRISRIKSSLRPAPGPARSSKKRARRRLKAWMRACAPNVLLTARLGICRHKAEWAAAGTLPGSPATITSPLRTRRIVANCL